MQTGGSGAQATSSGVAGRRQVRVPMCPLFGDRRNEDGSAGKTGLTDCLISEPFLPYELFMCIWWQKNCIGIFSLSSYD